jgi:hypothetical protein
LKIDEYFIKDKKWGDCQYTREDDNLSIGNVSLDEIKYSFFMGKFYCATIASSAKNRTEIFDKLKEKYGKPIIANGGYCWRGKRVEIQDLSSNSILAISFYYLPIWDKRNIAQKKFYEAEEKRKSDF